MNQDLPTRYDATSVEDKWYARWEESGLFQPKPGPGKPVYSITIPPPNVTGSLHMGHALCYPLQDLLGRYKRLRGYEVMILPGQDHAGISLQIVVDKLLRKEGSSAAMIGRDAFLERAWQWRRESGGTILHQFRSLGCAFDWSRERFTLDDHYHDVVLKVFIEWFDRGLIYRGKRVVNWDPALKTSVSDIETDRKMVKGKLYHVRYPFADGSGHIVIATTRPETMLADVAVAVHPEDDRYKGLVGKTLTLPLVGRAIPLVADEYPDPSFGTGAVKITPGHDANDFEVGQRHGLPILVVFDASAKVNQEGGPYAGLDRFEARKRIVADLEEKGLLERVEDHEIALVVSEKSGEVIEPLASEEWFMSQRAIADRAIDVVERGEIRFHPERYKEVYLDWLRNIRDWNVSRRLWWGHRIPVYEAEDGTFVAAMSWEEAEQKSGKRIVAQDDQVLDTWFSSGLWPFAVHGWPEDTDDFRRYYPTDVLVTARDIIFLWVARMVMMGLDFTGQVPFRDVFVYATVLTEDGKRMSKSLGTGIDPMDVITTTGADSLRFMLFSQTGANQDIRYSDKRVAEARNFCNKIWNASRFVLMNVDGPVPEPAGSLLTIDKWLLSRLWSTERSVREAYETYDIQEAAQALYRFFWSELCDWYIEVSKPRLASPEERATPQWVLLTAIESFLKMAHPIMPFITEEVHSHLPGKDHELVMASAWPEPRPDWHDPEAEETVGRWFEATRALRALRAELGIGPGKQADLAYFEGDLGEGAGIVREQAWIGELRKGRPSEPSLSESLPGLDVHLPMAGMIDPAKETARLEKERARLEEEISRVKARLSDPTFSEKAKPEVVEKAKSDLSERELLHQKVMSRIAVFRELLD
ncbi:MAG: valine--tRNA ligase [Fimbriimonadaceae bacterium]|nr:valine--tRNA ligase [Fimbriimonadaceae bacterium]QYK57973.1 MAG: valine--tRNA ligase [Fimbriimonadaceae bacterium]